MALNNLAVLETYLKDIIKSEEEILSLVEMREHIFEIKDQETSLGFISLYDLKAYVFEHEDEAKAYSVKNIDSSEWKNIFEHPYFQRRKPQLISTESLKNDDDIEFYILAKGQKVGPYERYELMEKVENREILLSEMVSYNSGLTWVKLYQVDGFDRRSLKDNEQLPGMPSNEFLNRQAETVDKLGETTDAMTSLAYLGNQKKGKTLDRQHEDSLKDEQQKLSNSTPIFKWLLILSICGIVYFVINIKQHLKSPFGTQPTSQLGEQAEMLKPVEIPAATTYQEQTRTPSFSNPVIDDQRRNVGKFEAKTIQPIRPMTRKSFMETKKFQDSMNQESPTDSEDSNYYYDNAAPMELDPVRSQISKENFDNSGETPANSDADNLFSGEISN